ncbi:MAG TPA: hypothetical protein VJ955_01645 [Desulfuromonadales bacterium]|nr:hypothetical protein [Desulfuromonadales bacterium]
MGIKEQWDEMRKSVQNLRDSDAHKKEEERLILHKHREEALHRVDKETGSETLDD